MPTIKLNQKSVDKLSAPDPSGKPVIYWDAEVKGFGVICSGKKNTKTYVAQRVLPDGKCRRITVGSASEIKVDAARGRAQDALDGMRRGVDPKQKTDCPTVMEAFKDYLAARKNLAESTRRQYRVHLENHLESWHDLPVKSITPRMVEARHREIAAEVENEKHGRKGAHTANMALTVFNILHNFLVDRVPDLPANPVKVLRRQWFDEPRREVIVRADDMPKFYQAVDGMSNRVVRDFILLVLFTGLRSQEARRLTWKDVDFQQRVIRVRSTETKAKRMLDLPMSDFVRNLLVARRSIGTDKFIFPGATKAGCIAAPRHLLEAMSKEAGIDDITTHDLRRTFCTIAARTAGVTPFAIKCLVNHSLGSSDVTAGYVIFTVEDLREAVQKIADRIKELCGIEAEQMTRIA